MKPKNNLSKPTQVKRHYAADDSSSSSDNFLDEQTKKLSGVENIEPRKTEDNFMFSGLQKIDEDDSDDDEDHIQLITTKKQRDKRIRPRVQLNPKGVRNEEIRSEYKIIMLGDANVGKTSLLLKFTDNQFYQ